MKQEDAILDWLRQGHSLSPLEALQRFQCLRLGARVFDLRRKGHAIVSRTERQGRKAWSVYMLNAAQRDATCEAIATGSISAPAAAAPLASEGA